jgi:hypothetical protein
MDDEPIDLDDRRGMSAQKATEIRRRLQEVMADQASLQVRQEELEAFLATEPVSTWPELAVKARYLIELFAATAEAQDARRQKLIKTVLEDFTRLTQ